MTKTTTKTSRLAIITSWVIALAIFIGLGLLLWIMPAPSKGEIVHKDVQSVKKTNVNRNKKIDKKKNEKPPKSLNALSEEAKTNLIKQAEVLTNKNLKTQLKKFNEMSEKIHQRKNELLDQVESRNLPSNAPADANETSMARNMPRAGNPPLSANASIPEMYAMLQAYETEIQKNNLAVNAAKQALTNGLSFPEVYKSLQLGSTFMSDFDQLIKNQSQGKEWERNPKSKNAAGLEINNTDDLNNYRGVLLQATRQVGLASARLQSIFGATRPIGSKSSAGNSSSSSTGTGTGEGSGGQSDSSNPNSKNKMNNYQGARLDGDMVKAQALPGRRFTKDAKRKGWLYINTWYMIGPWENFGRDDFAIIHPPEVLVDLDATYTDGQIAMGIIETDSDPIKRIGKKVMLDGTLSWKFMQSQSMHNTVPVTTDRSTYYAYTELYFDEASDMLVAIGTDDSGRVWINGKDVWQDKGTSWYHIDEYIVNFQFQQGWNKVFVRLENSGGGAAGFSLLICPKEAVDAAMVDDLP